MTRYSDYLKKRNPLSYPYRKFITYPYYSSLLSGKTLDFGCGIGDFLDFNSDAVGLDIDESSVAYCQKKGHEAYVLKNDKFPFDDNSFDSLIMDNVLEHISYPKTYWLEIKRVLKTEGLLLVIVPNKKGWKRDRDHVKYWDENNLPQELTNNGFIIISQRNYPLTSKFLGNSIWAYNCFITLAKPQT